MQTVDLRILRISLQHLYGGECFKCHRNKCNLCKNFLIESQTIQSLKAGEKCRIKDSVTYASYNIIYLVSCIKCKIRNVGSTSTEAKVRFKTHKSVNTSKRTCKVADNFNQPPHTRQDLSSQCNELIQSQNTVKLDRLLLMTEAFWSALYLKSKDLNNYFQSKYWEKQFRSFAQYFHGISNSLTWYRSARLIE